MEKGNQKENKSHLPEIIDYRITSECNLACPFCFGTRKSDILDLKEIFRFFEKMRELGLKTVVITGGEPTYSTRFKEIVLGLKKLGLQLYLSTNGFFWNRGVMEPSFIIDNFECISLPLEADNPDIHNSMRRGEKNHFDIVKEILEYIKENSNMKVKIGSVVTKNNYNNIANILDELKYFPDRWKLYQLCKSEYNQKYYEKNNVSDYEFSKVVKDIKEKYKNENIIISFLYEKDRDKKHLFLEPDGTLMVISDNMEKSIGNCSEDMSVLLKKIVAELDYREVENNFINSF